MSRLAWSLWGVAVAAIVAGVILKVVSPQEVLPAHLRASPADIIENLTILGLPTIGALIASRRRNLLGWLFCAAGLGLGLSDFGQAYAAYVLLVEPGLLPGGYAIGWASNWTWTLGVGIVPLLFLLFPTGEVLSRRWRPVAWVAAVCAGGLLLTAIAVSSFQWNRPFFQEVPDLRGAARILTHLLLGGVFAVGALSAAGLISTLMRFRRSRGEERQQLKWFATAASFFVAVLMLNFFIEDTTVLFSLATLSLYAAIAISILKYRLYDIDIVLNKAVVFGALALFITVIYVAVVVGIGTLVGTRGESNLLLSILATAIVAVAFHPIRDRARHIANRFVYGERATPYEVLAEFSERMAGAYAEEDLLPRMARILGEGTGASRADVWLKAGGELRPATSWPSDDVGPLEPLRLSERGSDLPAIPGVDHSVAVRHHGELLGAITLTKPPREPLTPTEGKLIADLASQAGLVLRNVGLTADLQARLEDLRASRQRLVKAQDEERRRLERNIHDGAQQQLVALAVKLGLAKALVGRDPEKERETLEQLQREATEALQDLRDLARGIYPPLLADQGLVAALSSQSRKSVLPVDVEADSIGRYPQEAEAAVYFCALEALQNVAKYSGASRAVLRLSSADDGHLSFAVFDDGTGFDPDSTPRGSGLTNMADRLAALGGELEVTSSPGRGTVVEGRLPVSPGEFVR